MIHCIRFRLAVTSTYVPWLVLLGPQCCILLGYNIYPFSIITSNFSIDKLRFSITFMPVLSSYLHRPPDLVLSIGVGAILFLSIHLRHLSLRCSLLFFKYKSYFTQSFRLILSLPILHCVCSKSLNQNK